MITPDTRLYIYEIKGARPDVYPNSSSFLGAWNEEEFTYYFFLAIADDCIDQFVSEHRLELSGLHEILYKDWQTGLPAHGVDVAGVRFLPADHPAPPENAVLLDPTVVFGDGTHPTTITCIKFMREIVDRHKIASMLDLGTGSGILALAGARMGIDKIVAVDKNILAVQTARENVEANRLSSINISEGEARFFIEKKYDLVAANLPYQVLLELVTLRGADQHPFWIVSGINEAQGEVLKQLFLDQQYSITNEIVTHPWTTFISAKRY